MGRWICERWFVYLTSSEDLSRKNYDVYVHPHTGILHALDGSTKGECRLFWLVNGFKPTVTG